MRIWVTRDETPGGPLSAALAAVGLTVVCEPVLQRRVINDAAETISRLSPDDWLVLTSVYAAEAVRADRARIPRVAVVGEASRRVSKARGFRVEHVSAGGDGKSLLGELRARVNRGKVCYPRSSLAEPPEPWAGVELLSPVLYVTSGRTYDRSVLDRVDVVSVASPSAVEVIGALERPFASIGPSTSAAVRKTGIEPWVEAPHRSFESLAQVIAAHASELRHHRA